MKERVKNVFNGQWFTSLIYLVLGICLLVFPGESVNLICKVIFGIVLMLAGLYHIWIYMSEDGSSTVFNLFTGAILLVLGVFFFQNPQIVKMILPSLLASLLLVDSIWTLRTGLRLKKYERKEWHYFVIVSLIFVTLGIILFINPFKEFKYTIIFAGVSFVSDAVLDFVSMILAVKGNRAIEKGELLIKEKEVNEQNMEDVSENTEEKKQKRKIGAVISEKIRNRKINKNNKQSEDESDKVQEVFGLKEEPDKVQEVFKLEEEPDKVQEVFKLEEEPDKVQEVLKLEEEADKIQERFNCEEEKKYLKDLLELDGEAMKEIKK